MKGYIFFFTIEIEIEMEFFGKYCLKIRIFPFFQEHFNFTKQYSESEKTMFCTSPVRSSTGFT